MVCDGKELFFQDSFLEDTRLTVFLLTAKKKPQKNSRPPKTKQRTEQTKKATENEAEDKQKAKGCKGERMDQTTAWNSTHRKTKELARNLFSKDRAWNWALYPPACYYSSEVNGRHGRTWMRPAAPNPAERSVTGPRGPCTPQVAACRSALAALLWAPRLEPAGSVLELLDPARAGAARATWVPARPSPLGSDSCLT